MNVLVTGSDGFIGRHVVERLRKSHNVVGVDRKQGYDIRFMLADGYPGPWPDAIVHLAAIADISSNWTVPGNLDSVWSHNVSGTRELLHAFPDVLLVFASSASVYGNAYSPVPFTEESLPHATSPYAASKLSGEHLLSAWSEKYGTPYHILRLGCVVGAGYTHGHIADFAHQARETGQVVSKSNGRGKRTHVHVNDVATTIEMCVAGAVRPGAYNVGSSSWSCRDTVDMMHCPAEWPQGETAWAGDIQSVFSSGKLRAQGVPLNTPVSFGVSEALKGLGWSNGRRI